MCEIARRAGSLGSRLTGAGWGGSTVHMVPQAKVDSVTEALRTEYYAQRFPDLSEEKLREAMVISKPSNGSYLYVQIHPSHSMFSVLPILITMTPLGSPVPPSQMLADFSAFSCTYRGEMVTHALISKFTIECGCLSREGKSIQRCPVWSHHMGTWQAFLKVCSFLYPPIISGQNGPQQSPLSYMVGRTALP
jgi:hypothetical protein